MKRFRFFVAGLVLILIGCPKPTTVPTNAGRAIDLDIPVPDFKLTERSGKVVSRNDLKGKVWVAAFVFTHCTGPCPHVSKTLAQLQKELKLAETPDLRLVTFTIDPDRDTPDALKKYAENYRADPDRWLFLRGEESELHRLATDGFKLLAKRSTTLAPKDGEEFDHSSRLAVVDRTGTIRAFFDGAKGEHQSDADFAEGLTKLKDLIGALLKE